MNKFKVEIVFCENCFVFYENYVIIVVFVVKYYDNFVKFMICKVVMIFDKNMDMIWLIENWLNIYNNDVGMNCI